MITVRPQFVPSYTEPGGSQPRPPPPFGDTTFPDYPEDDEIQEEQQHVGESSSFDLEAFRSWGTPADVYGSSQLGGAPLLPTQDTQEDFATPAPSGRPTRTVVPPEPLTYSAHHVRAQGRKAPKPGSVRGQVPKRGRH